jgi:hypothetical protein
MVPPGPFMVPIDGRNRLNHPYRPAEAVVSPGALEIRKMPQLPRPSFQSF